LLESALNNPRHQYLYEGEQDAVGLAVALLFAIARNHAFQQGNKRTGFEAALIFLENNGYELAADDSVFLAQMILDVLAGTLIAEEFTAAIRPLVVAAADRGDVWAFGDNEEE
jgi:death on curing protein